MRKWLRDLDRATVTRNKQAILYLFEQAQENPRFVWSAVDDDLAIDYSEFIDRANAVIGY